MIRRDALRPKKILSSLKLNALRMVHTWIVNPGPREMIPDTGQAIQEAKSHKVWAIGAQQLS